MSGFTYQEMFELGEDNTEYRKLTSDYVSTMEVEGRTVLKVDPEALSLLAKESILDIEFLLRPGHLQQLRDILDDPDASDNDRYVAYEHLKNAVIAADRVLPGCQDTGTAIVMAHKGESVFTGVDDGEALSRGIYEAYNEANLRYSQVAPLDMYTEKNTGTNLPAQIDIYSEPGNEYHVITFAKGGGSANKTFLFQQTKALLNPETLLAFIREKIKGIGTAACPPYHLALVIGGTSAELTLKTVKLASARYLDSLPTTGNERGRAFRDIELEAQVKELCQQIGLGAQFGGKYFAHDVRVIRLPRHGASCPVGLGVSCSADRHQPMSDILAVLTQYPVATRLSLTGTIVVGRDIAHARLKELVDSGADLPQYLKDHIVYYAGPAKKPEGYPSGSFGPTTAGRMDPYVDLFQSHGGSMIMLAKGNRHPMVAEACKKHGGFYLGSIGGPAARLAAECITHVEVLDYEDLGMEAIWKIEVKNFPAFIVTDDKGNDFYAELMG